MRGMNRVFGSSVALIIFSVAAAAVTAYGFAGQTTMVSVNSAGDSADKSATSGVLSGDGRYVVFSSSATNLIPGVVTTGTHVYRHENRPGGVTDLVSRGTSGNPGNNVSRDPSISADGRYVVFTSFASDLVDGDTNGFGDVFMRDMNSPAAAPVTWLVSTTGVPASGSSSLSGLPGAREISDDGRYVVFTSLATNLPGANGIQQVYRKDMTSDVRPPRPGAVELVSVNNATPAQAGDRLSQTPSISGNGRFVAFSSAATNFSPDSTSGIRQQVFVRDLVDGTTTLESPGTAAVTRSATVPVLSFDGQYLAFVADTSLDSFDLDNGVPDVYLRDRSPGGKTELASRSLNSVGGDSLRPAISKDGRWVAFDSQDETMAGNDGNGTIRDVFVYDRDNHTVTLVSLNDAGVPADAPSGGPLGGASVSSDGELVLFGSTASNLVAMPSTRGLNQLYVRKLNQAPVLPAFGRDLTLFEAQPLHLTWEFTDNDASTSWTATVDYGDGSGAHPLALNANKTFSLDHLYAPGSYDLTVEVTDDAGATSTPLVIHVVVSNVAPTVNLLSTLDLAFTTTLDTPGTFTDPGSNETYSATVNYGDGTGKQALALGPYDASPLVGGSFTLHHTYAAVGTYTVAVTISDGRIGGSTTANMVVTVHGYTYEWLDPIADMFVVGRNLPVKFTVRAPDGSFVLDQSVVVDVIDASGTVVVRPYVFGDQPSRSVMVSGDTYHVNVDTRDLAAAMYWLRVTFSSPTLTGEFTLGTTGTAATTLQGARVR
jgi:Tol biopolymer transport system component